MSGNAKGGENSSSGQENGRNKGGEIGWHSKGGKESSFINSVPQRGNIIKKIFETSPSASVSTVRQ